MSYLVSQNSVITTLNVGGKPEFLSCGGTNIAPKGGITWSNFSVSTSNFKYIFNSNNYIGCIKDPKVRGYPASNSTAPATIKQFLYDNGNIQYVCGQFVLSNPLTATNIMYFNPNLNNSTTGDATFNNLSTISFSSNSTVNCMAFLNNTDGSVDTTKLVIAGTFSNATIGGTSSFANIALLNFATPSTWTINTSIVQNGTTDGQVNASTTTINSIILIGDIIYVAGVGGAGSNNCLFYSYNTTTSTWTNLLSSSNAGTINVIKKTTDNIIAIGGGFITLEGITCNNIALYTIGVGFSALGDGVQEVPASSPIYASPCVFALDFLKSTATTSGDLWIGGYFIKAGGLTANSIALYKINTNTWEVIDRTGDNASPTTKGLLSDTADSTNPGVVYTMSISALDTSVITVGGSFRTLLSKSNIPATIYNLVKIITSAPSNTAPKRSFTKFNSTST